MGTLQAHIRLDVSLNIPYALLPGDPARIDHIARHLENVTELAYNREFRSISGTYKGVQVLAVSTGIGGASMGIALEELHGCGVPVSYTHLQGLTSKRMAPSTHYLWLCSVNACNKKNIQ